MRVLLQKGRVANNFLDTLVDKKYIKEVPDIGRKLKININDLELMLVKPSDIALSLDNGIADIAVLGSDVIEEEYNNKYVEVFDFNDNKCKFMLAGLPNINIEEIKVIGTKYPNIAKKYLLQMKKTCEILKLNGSLELYPNINLCDGIIDIVETGSTLRDNGLVILRKFECVSTRIITTKEKENNCNIKRLINELR